MRERAKERSPSPRRRIRWCGEKGIVGGIDVGGGGFLELGERLVMPLGLDVLWWLFFVGGGLLFAVLRARDLFLPIF